MDNNYIERLNLFMKTQGYKINYATNTITVTKKFQQEAGIIGSAAFEQMKVLREMGMIIVEKKTKSRKSTTTYAQMELYISLVENSERYLKEFWAKRNEAKTKGNPYIHTLKWFRDTFPRFNDEVEFNEACEIIVKPADYPEEIEVGTRQIA